MADYRISADALLQLAIFARGSSGAYSASIIALLKDARPITEGPAAAPTPDDAAEAEPEPEAEDEPAGKIAKPE